jgi:hypothetical protein
MVQEVLGREVAGVTVQQRQGRAAEVQRAPPVVPVRPEPSSTSADPSASRVQQTTMFPQDLCTKRRLHLDRPVSRQASLSAERSGEVPLRFPSSPMQPQRNHQR